MSNTAPSHILALGDSLTEGYYYQGFAFNPYATKLQELLSQAGNAECKVQQRGVSGELVMRGMQARLQAELAEAQSKALPYDWVLLLGGTNDICSDLPSAKVFQGLQNMYAACKSHGARVLAMTLMENVESLAASRMEAERKAFNALIRQHCRDNQHDVVLCDLDVLLPYVGLTAERRAELFDDGLHLTPKGYDHMAELIFEVLKTA